MCFIVQLSDLQDALEKIHKKTLQNVPLNPLQKKTRIPFETFSAPLEVKEDLSFKKKTFKSEIEKKCKDVTSASDLFEIEGKCTEKVYLLGEAGRGKTGQCYQLIQHWVQARKEEKEKEQLKDWEKGLAAYDLVFLITLRHVHKKSVVEMICENVLKEYPQFHSMVRDILKGGPRVAKCLILLDGLDEMKGKPEIDVDMSRCTIIATSRHWKFLYADFAIGDRDRVVEVFGLNEEGVVQVIKRVLVNYFQMDESSQEFANQLQNMKEKTSDPELKSIMRIPLLLTLSVHLWQSNTSTDGSMTSFFALLVNFLLKVALENGRITDPPPQGQPGAPTAQFVPFILKRKEKLKTYLDPILTLGKLGYKDLVLENLEKNAKNQEATQLVFEKDVLENELGISLLTFALNVGLLSQSSAPGAGDDDNVSINFFHKTIEEFLAALYLVCSDEVSFASFRRSCSSSESVIELSNILLFTVGLQPNLGSTVLEHIAQTAGSDSGIIRYRQGFGDDQNDEYRIEQRVMEIFKTVSHCHKEMEYTLTQSETKTSKNRLPVSDVYIDRRTNDSTIAFANELLSQDKDNIVSLYVECKESMSFQVVKDFLDKTSSLQALYFEGDREISPTWCIISPIFSSLTAVSFKDISLTHEAVRDLQKFIQSNAKLQSLTLQSLGIKQNASELKDVCRGSSVSKIDGSDVTGISLDMKINKQLRTLSLETHTLKHANIVLVDITQCKSLINLTLNRVQIQSGDMLHAALSSFTQLKNLTLDSVSFSDDKKDKICLDLAVCTGLTTLDLSCMQVKDVEISPVSLLILRISHVSGSLRGLFSSLRKCQNLAYLRIESLSGEHDADVCLDLKTCSRLEIFKIINVHVDRCYISTVSLIDLAISNVSGSLQVLLSSLPDCKHLTDLSIGLLSDEQDVKLLWDVLPRLTQVRRMTYDVVKKWYTGNEGLSEAVTRMTGLEGFKIRRIQMKDKDLALPWRTNMLPPWSMTYDVGTRWDSENEGAVGYHSAVAQAVTMMTGLERLRIEDVDMGDLALTLTPLMTRINDVMLSGVRMTASSWGEFIASLLDIKHGFDIRLYNINIDDESVSSVYSSTYFKVTEDIKTAISVYIEHPFKAAEEIKGDREGNYFCLHFSKLRVTLPKT